MSIVWDIRLYAFYSTNLYKLSLVKLKMRDTKLAHIEPGLVKLAYSWNQNPQEELALKMSRSLADGVRLPNDVLCYNYFLRESMKAAWTGGLEIIGPFSGSVVRDEHIASANGRVVILNDSFDAEKDFNPLLIACNSPYFRDAIAEMKGVILVAGFDVDKRDWEAYKAWEQDTLKTFG